MQSLPELKQFLQQNIKPHNKIKSLGSGINNYKGLDWQSFVEFSAEKYNRINYFTNHNFEMYILCWNPGQCSPIHDHPPEGCIMKVLQGELTEETYDINSLDIIATNTVKPSSISYIDNNIAFHKISNETDKPAISLHIYAPPEYEQRIISII